MLAEIGIFLKTVIIIYRVVSMIMPFIRKLFKFKSDNWIVNIVDATIADMPAF